MQCPKCGCEAFIKDSEIVVEGDKSSDTETKVYRRLNFYCRNPNCENNSKKIGEKLNLIYSK